MMRQLLILQNAAPGRGARPAPASKRLRPHETSMKTTQMHPRGRRDSVVTRRHFIAAASGTMLAGGLNAADQKVGDTAPATKLAANGGPKAVRDARALPRRWGDPERVQLNAMLDQDSLFYWKGQQTALLTQRFQKLCPAKYVQTCSSGTAALHIAVAAAGIGPGDEVITSPITDMGTVIGVLYQQAVPVFADLGASTYNLNPSDVERRITPRTKAIIAVHLCGNPCDMSALKEIADRRGLILIEDCAQAWGARYRGRPVGTIGHFGCFSLQNSKHVTCGDGGIVCSNDEKFGPLLQMFGDKGADRTKGGGHTAFATNYRMSEPQAAVAAAQLARAEDIVAKRSSLGNLLSSKISGTPGITPHGVHAEDRCGYWFYFFRMRPDAFRCNRAEFVRALAAEGAGVSAGYIPVPLYGTAVFQRHGFFAGRWPIRELGLTEMDYAKVSLPEVDSILKTGIRFGVHEAMTEDHIISVAEAIRKVASHYAA